MMKKSILVFGLLLGAAAPLTASPQQLIKAIRAGDLDLVKASFAGSLSEQQVANLVNFKLKQTGDTSSPLMEAIDKGRRDIVEYLLSKGADAQFKTKHQHTPLHLAAAYGRKDIAEVLLAHGAQIDAKNAYGNTPLFEAALFEHLDMVKYLISKGANIKTLNENKENVLDYIVDRFRIVNKSPNEELVKYLV